ncbi:MAG TPA: hypothetical protein V6D20_13975 [Candidatus Obscuribacterales bacterium]
MHRLLKTAIASVTPDHPSFHKLSIDVSRQTVQRSVGAIALSRSW